MCYLSNCRQVEIISEYVCVLKPILTNRLCEAPRRRQHSIRGFGLEIERVTQLAAHMQHMQLPREGSTGQFTYRTL